VRARELLPIAASASMLVAPIVGSSSAAVRVPMHQVLGVREMEPEATLIVFPSITAEIVHEDAPRSSDLFTSRDMAILNAVARATVEDDLDYSDLFDYDD
jgi:hypothetical protein